jgi:hypothetical protein
MKYLMERLGVVALLAALLCGCAKNSPRPSVDPRAFDAAAPEIKQAWDEALAASAANDPGSAISSLRLLSRQNISLEQRKAAQNALVVYEAKLREDAKRGDPAARKAMEVLGFGSPTPNR